MSLNFQQWFSLYRKLQMKVESSSTQLYFEILEVARISHGRNESHCQSMNPLNILMPYWSEEYLTLTVWNITIERGARLPCFLSFTDNYEIVLILGEIQRSYRRVFESDKKHLMLEIKGLRVKTCSR